MRSATPPLDLATRYRVLGHPTDLPGHLATLGPLPVPHRADRQWRDSLVAMLEDSGLTGRGGAGFPAALKLAAAGRNGGGGVLVVNGMEGEPASDKDKVLLMQAPHLVLDGAQLLATACGAVRVVVCVPAGRDAVAGAVAHAMTERAGHGYATLHESVARPPDRFVAGEESALVRWLEDGRSLPAYRPDKRIPLRIGKQPVLVHNTETLAHMALISRLGPEAFRQRGVREDPGTTLITVSGAVARPGVVEVDRGTPLQDLVDLADPTDTVVAMLVGGYGGAWVGPDDFATPYASLALRTIGASAGVGVVVALGASTCGIDYVARVVRYMAQQTAGQCGPCVFGLPAIADDMELLARRGGNRDLLPRLHGRLAAVDRRGGCRHPDGVVQMVRSALVVLATDVEAHQRRLPCSGSH